MSKVERFEDLRCWQEARSLVKEIYLIAEYGKLAKDFDTRSQLRACGAISDEQYSRGLWKI